MPKMKTKSGAKKRFRVRGSGSIKRSQAFKRHILTKKSTKTKRQLRGSAEIHSIAGPMRASRLGSGPTAKGVIVTSVRKNTTPIEPEPPSRRAMRISRR